MSPFHLPPGRRRRFLMLAGTVVVIGAALVYVTVAFERKREVDALHALGDSLAALRVASDACRHRLARDETSFRRFDSSVDSLRARVEEFEALDPGGVPSREYEAYLSTFDRYNASVEEWEARADSLRADEVRCRELAESHNLLADSLRRRVEEWEARRGG